jgi:hypothetical protein
VSRFISRQTEAIANKWNGTPKFTNGEKSTAVQVRLRNQRMWEWIKKENGLEGISIWCLIIETLKDKCEDCQGEQTQAHTKTSIK